MNYIPRNRLQGLYGLLDLTERLTMKGHHNSISITNKCPEQNYTNNASTTDRQRRRTKITYHDLLILKRGPLSLELPRGLKRTRLITIMNVMTEITSIGKRVTLTLAQRRPAALMKRNIMTGIDRMLFAIRRDVSRTLSTLINRNSQPNGLFTLIMSFTT